MASQRTRMNPMQNHRGSIIDSVLESVNTVTEKKDVEVSVHNVRSLENFGLSAEDATFLADFPEDRRKKVLRKLDWRLVPMLALLYLMSYLDRANIGNAKIEGLMKDLNMTGTQYNIALSIYLPPYILLEIPCNSLLMRFKRPSVFMGVIVLLWGTVMTLTGIVKDFKGLLIARFMLGVCEAGFFPGAILIISRWYLPNETQTRIALFFSSSATAGAFSGLLAFAITKMNGIAGLAGWRWIFIIEGLASVALGVVCFFLLVDSPALSTRWLEPDEIRYLELRQLAQHGMSERARAGEKTRKWSILRSVLLDWQIYLLSLIALLNGAPNFGMKYTMPQIIKNMGFTSSNAQLMTIPPYILGAVAAFVASLFADRLKWRMPFIIGAQCTVLTAFAILYTKAQHIDKNFAVCYFAIILACLGFYPVTPGVNAWTVNNLAGPTKRAQGIAYMIALSNLGGIIGSFIYIEKESPRYPTGFGASLSFEALGILACITLELTYWTINKRRDELREDQIRDKYSDDEIENLGDRSPIFRYTL